jgi:hypothetical protein
LIVCEGQTEKLYFESFPVLGVTVNAINLKGQAKLKLVQTTQEVVTGNSGDFDEVWCVFDMDVSTGANEFSDFDNAIHKAHHLNFSVAYSNDAFELWFYLHYKTVNAEKRRAFYYKELAKFFDLNYEKEGKQYRFGRKVYQYLLDDEKASQYKAIKRAEKLLDRKKHLPFHAQNPATRVHILVELLNENLRE